MSTDYNIVSQDDLYRDAAAAHGRALERLVRAYEADLDKRRDLLQDIHLAIWRSFEKFEDRCSLRTWVYRVAHNVAVSHVIQQHRMNSKILVGLAEVEALPEQADRELETEKRMALERLLQLIHRLKPFDRQLMLLYLEGLDAASIGEITGLSSGHVRVQIHRIKTVLSRRFHGGDHG